MSDKWIEKEDRLLDAVGKDKAKEIRKEIILNTVNVEKSLIRIDKTGKVNKSTISNLGYIEK